MSLGGLARGGHQPVMLSEVMAALAPRDDGIYVDGTFGAGGYSRALLEAANCVVWGIDRDPDIVARGQALARAFPGRLTLVPGRFGRMDVLLGARGVGDVDGVALDLGVSSLQLDDPARGFSFRRDGPLDMRMERTGPTAADVVNQADEGQIARILRDFGEERRARRIARAIVTARKRAPITRTLELAKLVRSVGRPSADGIDPATRTFQALRIYVNDELGELERGLEAAERLLKAGGRLAVVCFHSLEDRMVKLFLNERGGRAPRPHRHAPPDPEPARPPTFRLRFRGALKPKDEEVAANPRARSARLRAAERVEAPPWEEPA